MTRFSSQLTLLVTCIHLLLWARLSSVTAQDGQSDHITEVKVEQRSLTSGLCSQTKRSKPGDVISYHYCGRLTNGHEFDCSFNYGQPYVFTIGSGQVIKGMDVGLTGVCVGDALKVTIPSHLAYGTRGTKGIPGNSVLIFYVKVLQIVRDGEPLDGSTNVYALLATAASAYRQKEWNRTVSIVDKTIALYEKEETAERQCTAKCLGASLLYQPLEWSTNIFTINDCYATCLSEITGHNFDQPSSATKKRDLKRRLVYDYLQMSYFKLGEVEKAASAALTYHSYNQNDSSSQHNIKYYFALDEIKSKRIALMEDVPVYVSLFHNAVKLYNDAQHEEAAEQFEKVIGVYDEHIRECWKLCYTSEVLDIPRTTHDLAYDVVVAYKRVLRCQLDCKEQSQNLGTSVYADLHARLYDFLQFSYYQTGQVERAVRASATIDLLNADIAQGSLEFYRSLSGISSENFQPRPEALAIHKVDAENEKLLLELEAALPDNPLEDDGEPLDAEALAEGKGKKSNTLDVNLFSTETGKQPVGPPVSPLVPEATAAGDGSSIL
ncbi:endoplasmic reticulum protein SC65-like [Sycon ciliatum]|uniref:endoplasmic reticulum protein SC65-like n=1 Tax=Sycon ciliatum TaxID=27933 RepID=UPI0031F68B40